MTHLILNIPDMHCSSCAMKLEGIEDELPGILKINASYHRQTLEVEYDEAQVSEAQILAGGDAVGLYRTCLTYLTLTKQFSSTFRYPHLAVFALPMLFGRKARVVADKVRYPHLTIILRNLRSNCQAPVILL